MFDPSNSAFGVLAAAFCPRRRVLAVVEEVYAKDAESTTKAILNAILPKIARYNPDMSAWDFYYDPAAKWFYQESLELKMAGSLPEGFILKKSPKREGTKEEGLSSILTLLDEKRLIIASHCKNTIWEMECYKRDKNGNIPKKGDNNIDNLRYLVTILGKQIASINGIESLVVTNSERRPRRQDRDIVKQIIKRFA
jgi:hypothetical protein